MGRLCLEKRIFYILHLIFDIIRINCENRVWPFFIIYFFFYSIIRNFVRFAKPTKFVEKNLDISSIDLEDEKEVSLQKNIFLLSQLH